MFTFAKTHWRLRLLSYYYWLFASYIVYIGIITPLLQWFSSPAQQIFVIIPGLVIFSIFLALWLYFLGWWLSRRSVGAHGFAVITQGALLLFLLPAIFLINAYILVFLVITSVTLAFLLDRHTRLLFLESPPHAD